MAIHLHPDRFTLMAIAARDQMADHGRQVDETLEDLDACSCGLALQGEGVQAYNEAGFRYFLGTERKRSEISGRPFLLLLVDLSTESGVNSRLEAPVAFELFSSLVLSLRETDFVGWYRTDYVVGAVLTQHTEVISTDVSRLVGRRFKASLCERLSEEMTRRLQIRVYRVSSEAPELNEPANFTDRKNGLA
jgi:hypothetical protein